MNEIVNLVVQKTGISEDKAQQVVSVIVEHLKDRLPAPVASQLSQYVSGESSSTESESSGMLGSLFGKKAS